MVSTNASIERRNERRAIRRTQVPNERLFSDADHRRYQRAFRCRCRKFRQLGDRPIRDDRHPPFDTIDHRSDCATDVELLHKNSCFAAFGALMEFASSHLQNFSAAKAQAAASGVGVAASTVAWATQLDWSDPASSSLASHAGLDIGQRIEPGGRIDSTEGW